MSSHTFIIDFSSLQGPPLNPLGRKLREFILENIEKANQDPQIHSIILTGGRQHFSAGADLTEFASFTSMEHSITLIDVVNAIENSDKPVVAAIEGACLGGGLEVALACHYRVCSPKAKLGLPEVHVGVIPGAGGTQRLPKLVGLEQALTMILTGVPVSGDRAQKIGLVDECTINILEKAKELARFAELNPVDPRRVGKRSIKEHPAQAHVMLQMASLNIPKRGGEGLTAALEAIRAACTLPLEDGMKVEGEMFLETLLSEQGKARRHAFFAERAAQKMTTSPDKGHILLQQKSTPVAVIGAGTMGSGIAIVLLTAGYQVTLVDVSKESLDKGVKFIKGTIQSRLQRKKIAPQIAESMTKNLRWTQNIDDLSDSQLVVEAVVENMKIKQSIFLQLDRVAPKTSILLSNTSTLDIDQMASVLSLGRRKSFAGWHFFSPAHVMRLVEIVVGKETSPETVALLQALTKKIQKLGVVVGNCDGFCGNRLLRPYSSETCMLLVEGHGSIAQVDAALVDFGMALGPFQLGDLAGNDVGFFIRVERGHARRSLNDAIPKGRPTRYTEIGDVMVSEFHRSGQKVGKGWYDYDLLIGNGRKGLESKEMAELITKYKVKNGKSLSPKEIVEHSLFPLVNEGFKCLEEGIVRRPSDIDIVYLYGYGWPVWRGGPMYWADHQVGLPYLLDWLVQKSKEHVGVVDYFVPSKLLEECVKLNCTVSEYYERQSMNNSKL